MSMSIASVTHLLPLAHPSTGAFTAAALLVPATSRRMHMHSRVCPSSRKVTSNSISPFQCNSATDAIQHNLAVTNWLDSLLEDGTKSDKIRESLDHIKSLLTTMDDGDINISPYDTAWVALVEDIGGSGGPQFPSCLEWIVNNQLPDGSWGDIKFLAHDRILNTLACVVALRKWNVHPDKSNRGLSYIKENLYRIEEENPDHMLIGFEVAFPSLIEIAKRLGIDIPDDSPGLKEIYASRDLKLKKIPRELMHKVPTPLLYSLEGMEDLDWNKLLELKYDNGSFLSSPASTAFVVQHTKDPKCLKYLSDIVLKFNGGVPNAYPVDMFEHIWAVDRLERLGISRFFQKEIEECVEYVYRYWSNDSGISWARNTNVQDIDDTSMGFRILRLHGYEVSTDAFKQFKNGEEFVGFNGQYTQAVTGMYDLYKAAEVMFPGEKMLEDAKKFSKDFLEERRANNQLHDKWVIAKDTPGEVVYALDNPWYGSLPRVESRFYLEQYGGEDDVWIGKTLFRMFRVSNNTYLELAKKDYNSCQALHQLEWKSIQKWYESSSLGEFGLSKRSLLLAYFIAAASVFAPEQSKQRLAWAKTTILLETIVSYFDRQQLSREHKRAFIDEFEQSRDGQRHKTIQNLARTLRQTLNHLSLNTLMTNGRDIHQQLYHAWKKWLRTWEEGGDMGQRDVELLMTTLNVSGGEGGSRWVAWEEELLSHPKYKQLLEVTGRVCDRLRLLRSQKEQDTNGDMGGNTTVEIESDMKQLVELVLTKSAPDDLDSNTKNNFLAIARSNYYAAYCNLETINFHISKVLFERVL